METEMAVVMKQVVVTKYRGRVVLASRLMDKEEAETFRAKLLEAFHDELWDDVQILERPE